MDRDDWAVLAEVIAIGIAAVVMVIALTWIAAGMGMP